MVNNSIYQPPSKQRSCSLDYLRATVIILVLFLHTIACYLPWARFNFGDYVHSTAPIIDINRSTAFNLLPLLLNGFFMALLFFLSGLFVWRSLDSKGSTYFLKARLRRLGIPLLIMVAVIMPIAYYPSFLQTGSQESFFSYWCGWSWISGPAWYLLVLFGFDLFAAISFRVVPKSCRRVPGVFIRNPSLFFWVLVLLSGAFFIPMWALYGPYQWFELAPFTIVQACRIGLYAVYFFAGVVVGAKGLQSTFLVHAGPLSSHWRAWLLASLFAAIALCISFGEVNIDIAGPWTRPDGWFVLGICLVIYSATLSMAFLALFLRFVNIRYTWADSLSKNSYAIYIVHYPFVIWTQYLLLSWSMAAEIKAVVVISVSLGLSWGTSFLLRRISIVNSFKGTLEKEGFTLRKALIRLSSRDPSS